MKQQNNTNDYAAFKASSYLDGNSAAYVEGLYEDYLHDPAMVPAPWRKYFDELNAGGGDSDVSHEEIRRLFADLAKHPLSTVDSVPDNQAAVDHLINAYRRFGHLAANTNPLHKPGNDKRLDFMNYGLSDSMMQQDFLTRGVLPQTATTLADILSSLRAKYCSTIGYEVEYIDNDEEREWLEHHIEQNLSQIQFSGSMQKHILEKLTAAAGLEKYLDVKYPGQKRFSNEGIDSFIPMLDQMNNKARSQGIKEIKIGMAHRGRINILLNIMGQSASELFQEFDGTKDYGMTTGDVKYHLGFSSDIETPSGPVHLSLAFNPSHLEFINPVVMGSTRARQDHHAESEPRDYAMPILVHGDSAFAGQGIVMETLSMAHTRAYTVGGSVHIILNNQVGFTTSDVRDTRSSKYCSDLGKMISVPIIHVNADDPEAVIKVVHLVMDYRERFHKDVVIDLIGFRRHGHQEVDEPRATQPMMYKIIDSHLTSRIIYANKLIAEGVTTQAEVDKLWNAYRDTLDAGTQTIKTLSHGLSEHYATNWTPYIGQKWTVSVDTSVSLDKIKQLASRLEALPDDFQLQRNVGMLMNARKKMSLGEQLLDWGYAETMAYATLVDQGIPVRLSGEDCERGTFFHRHSVLHDINTGQEFMPLKHISDDQAQVNIYNSLLSEAATLGFEYGYALAEPDALVMWEAQFGDFANGAQVIIDQFISSGWQKWNRLSGLVMLLPHGYEGMGPEHSSARLERYMQLCAQDNMQVCVPSTPAQIFHLLRRQVLRPYRKPLIVLSPKSLLRHKLAVSTLEDLSTGHFRLVIPEMDSLDLDKVRRVVACSGKVYYDLLKRRREEKIDDIAIIRVEQLYPFPYEDFSSLLEDFPHATELVWCQEEPKNQGAWFITHRRLLKTKRDNMQLMYSCRPPSAAPAAGYPALFKKLQKEVIDRALDLDGMQPFADE